MSTDELKVRQLPSTGIFRTQLSPSIQAASKITLKLPKTVGQVSSVSSSLRKQKNSVIIPFQGYFFYVPFPIQGFVRVNTSLFKAQVIGSSSVLDKIPFRDCFICIGESIYFFPIEDMERGVVRESRKLDLKRGTITYDDFKNGTFVRAADRRLFERLTGKISSAGVETQPSEIYFGADTGQEVNGQIHRGQQNEAGQDSNGPTPSLFSKTARSKPDLKYRGSVQDFDLDELKAIELAMQNQERALFSTEGS